MNILTWFQYLGKEDWNSMSPILNSYFIERKRLETGVDKPIGFEESKVWLYDMHDAKLWYELFAHSLWSRKHHRFLLCACTSYARVCDNSSENCHFINDLDFAQKYEFSKERWEDRMARGVQYSKDSHKNWCDEHNFGITHFAVKPQSMPPSHVRFDMFHMKCAVTRNLMNYIRFLVQKQGKPLRDSFTENVLRGIFHRFHIFCWNNNFAFSIMKGNDLGRFVLNLPTVTAFLRSNLIPTDEITALVGALDLVGGIFSFMSMSYIDDHEEYVTKKEQFKIDLELFYEFGRSTFLKENESFYMHCMRFYLPTHADVTFERHQLGLGIFNMQGFERRNKESKNSIHRFTTMNRNSPHLLVNNMKRLLRVFQWNVDSL